MTENHDLAPEADVQEQRLPSGTDVDDADTTAAETSLPWEADPADAADQAAAVPMDDEDDHRAGT